MKNKIPNIFHFVFGLRRQDEPFHLAFFLCLNSCRMINKPDCIYFYYHYMPHGHYWDLIKPYLTLVEVPLVADLSDAYGDNNACEQFSYAHQADFIRIEKAMALGGVYADMDTLFIKKIPQYLFEMSFVMGREPDVFCTKRQEVRPSLCNAFFMTEPNSIFAKRWLELMPKYFDGTWSNHSCYLPYELSTKMPNDIHIEPLERFFSVVWTKQDLHNFFERDATVADLACSVHLWNHLWWSPRRKDFSNFNHFQISESSIRKVDTTFNRLARPYLPQPDDSPLLARTAYQLALRKHAIGEDIGLVLKKLRRLFKR